jgi:hypothetical protein
VNSKPSVTDEDFRRMEVCVTSAKDLLHALDIQIRMHSHSVDIGRIDVEIRNTQTALARLERTLARTFRRKVKAA